MSNNTFSIGDRVIVSQVILGSHDPTVVKHFLGKEGVVTRVDAEIEVNTETRYDGLDVLIDDMGTSTFLPEELGLVRPRFKLTIHRRLRQ